MLADQVFVRPASGHRWLSTRMSPRFVPIVTRPDYNIRISADCDRWSLSAVEVAGPGATGRPGAPEQQNKH